MACVFEEPSPGLPESYGQPGEFYDVLARRCGAEAIACLGREDCLSDSFGSLYESWEKAGNQGLFGYLDSRREILLRPFANRPWARRILVLTFRPRRNQTGRIPELPLARPGRPSAKVASFLYNEDYHRVGQEICRLLRDSLVQRQSEVDWQFEAQTDAGPALEKELVSLGGLGSFGRNNLLQTSASGCLVHLAVAFTSLELPVWHGVAPARPLCDKCGKCRLACPSGCLDTFPPDYRNCASYLTMEKAGPLSWEEQVRLGGRLLGCSSCTSCCPSNPAELKSADVLVDPEEILRMPTRELERRLAGSGADHAGTTRLKRNAAAALGFALEPHERAGRRDEMLSLSNSEAVRQTILAWPND